MIILFTGTKNIFTKANDFVICTLFIGVHINSKQGRFYKEGKSQKLNRQEADERNQDKKAIAADS